MTLCGDNDYDLKLIFNHFNISYSDRGANLLSFDQILFKISKFDDTEDYFCRLPDEFSFRQ